ncbi:MAG: PqqD family protein [Bacteroidaceae bacterium]
MHFDSKYKVRAIAGEYIVVDQGRSKVDMTQIISLNSSANLLWEQLSGKEFTAEQAIQVLTDHYDITREQAAADVEKFLTSMRNCHILHD